MNILIKAISLTNFGCFNEIKANFSQNKVIYLTGGNGEGKTLLLEGIFLALSPNHRKGDTYSEYVNSEHPDKPTQVKLSCEINKEPLEIEVNIADKENSTTTRIAQYKDNTYKGSEVVKLLAELDLDYFSQIIFFMQNSPDITKMTPVELAENLRKLLNWDVEKHTSKIEEVIDTLNTTILTLSERAKLLEEKTNDISSKLSEEKPLPNTLEEHKKALDEINENEKIKNECIQDMVEIEKYNKEFKTLEFQKSELSRSIISEQEDINKSKEKLNNYESTLQSLDNKKQLEIQSQQLKIEQYNKELEELQAQSVELITLIQNTEEKINNKNQEIKENKKEVENIENTLQKIKLLEEKKQIEIKQETLLQQQSEISQVSEEEQKNKINEFDENIKIIEEGIRLANLQDEGKCPHCGQPTDKVSHVFNYEDKFNILTSDKRKRAIILNEQKEAKEEEVKKQKEIKEKVTQLNTLIQVEENKKAKIIEILGDFTLPENENIEEVLNKAKDTLEKNIRMQAAYDSIIVENNKTHDKVKDKIAGLRKIAPTKIEEIEEKYKEEELKFISLKQLLSKELEVKNSNLEGLKNLLENKEKEIKEYTSKPPKITRDLETIQKLLPQLDEVLKTAREKTEKFNQTILVNEEIKKNNIKIKTEFENDCIEKEKILEQIKEKTDELAAQKEAKLILEKNLPNYLTLKTCAKLEQLINGLLQVIFPDIKIELVQNKKGVSFYYWPTKDSKKKRSIKMASGFQAMLLSVIWKVALAKGYNIDFLILDECDAASTEENSIEIFSQLINSGLFNQMFIVSHKSSTIEALRRMNYEIVGYKVENRKLIQVM
jgi:DNA repair exonuclease SbcCD ATPase subunit